MSVQNSVSVCIPVFNAAKYLPDCLASIMSQTCAPAEIILLDDASTDRSLAVARRLAMGDSRIKVFSKKHTALGDTRNQLVRSSHGEFVAFLDADDVAMPDRLAKQIAFMTVHPRCVVLGGQARFVDEWGHKFYNQPCQQLDPGSIETELLRGRASAIWQTTVMLRRDAFEAAGGYDPTLNCSEDMELHLRLSECGELWNLPDILVQIRRYAASITSTSRFGEAEARRERLVMLACERRGIKVPPLLEFAVEPLSRFEWYMRTARGFMEKRSFRVALMHCMRGLICNPMNADGWVMALTIARRMIIK